MFAALSFASRFAVRFGLPRSAPKESRTVNDTQTTPASPARWKRPLFLVLAVAAVATVLFTWFHTPTVVVAADGAGNENITLRCTNSGPSTWDPPTVNRGQELSNDFAPPMQTHNQQILKNDIESLRVSLACSQARDAHTNTLVVTVFAAGAVLFFGHSALWVRRDRPRTSTPIA